MIAEHGVAATDYPAVVDGKWRNRHLGRVARRAMSQEARNDSKAKRLIDMTYAEGVNVENIVRLLNYHFAETYSVARDTHNKAEIRRVPDGSNWAPPVTIWRQP